MPTVLSNIKSDYKSQRRVAVSFFDINARCVCVCLCLWKVDLHFHLCEFEFCLLNAENLKQPTLCCCGENEINTTYA